MAAWLDGIVLAMVLCACVRHGDDNEIQVQGQEPTVEPRPHQARTTPDEAPPIDEGVVDDASETGEACAAAQDELRERHREARPDRCTLKACGGPTVVRFHPSEWPVGRYEVAVQSGSPCSFRVAADGSVHDDTCGAWAGATEPRPRSMFVDGTPDEVAVRVTIDGKRQPAQVLPIHYTALAINGPGCGPLCCLGQARLEPPR